MFPAPWGFLTGCYGAGVRRPGEREPSPGRLVGPDSSSPRGAERLLRGGGMTAPQDPAARSRSFFFKQRNIPLEPKPKTSQQGLGKAKKKASVAFPRCRREAKLRVQQAGRASKSPRSAPPAVAAPSHAHAALLGTTGHFFRRVSHQAESIAPVLSH